MNEYLYLAHGGPGSGRYPLGSGERPYQKYEGSGRKSGVSGYISAKKKEKQRLLETKKKLEEEKHIANKERVLKSGSAKDVSKYSGELTRQELQDVYNRLNLEKKINEMSYTEILESQKIINRVLNNLKTTSEWVATGAVSYNILASVYNSLIKDKNKKLPTISIQR